jgi:hypothetical protein
MEKFILKEVMKTNDIQISKCTLILVSEVTQTHMEMCHEQLTC